MSVKCGLWCGRLAALAAVLCLSAVEARAQCSGNVCTVNVAADPGTSSSGATGGAGTLSYALAYANAQSSPVTINIQTNVTLSGPLSPIFNSVTINGNGNTISGNNTTRIFMVGVDEATRSSGAVAGSIVASRPQVSINSVTLASGVAQGGNGGSGGGGGMGAGGALFVNASADVTLSNVSFANNAARGGAGGFGGGGGGGGLGGNGGAGGGGIFGNGNAGGGGIFGAGGGVIAGGGGGYSGNGGNGGTANPTAGAAGALSIAGLSGGGGTGSGGSGRSGGSNGGGGGGAPNTEGGGGGFSGGNGVFGTSGGTGGFGGGGGVSSFAKGGDGGFGGGGGITESGNQAGHGGFGGGGAGTLLAAGHGGFGGGGGSSAGDQGGNGGFGAGGGYGDGTASGSGGFGGGNAEAPTGNSVGAGGGGAGMGGAVFVVQGGTLTVTGSGTTSGGAVTGGTAGGAGGGNGSAFGSGYFLQGNGTVAFNPAASQTQTISDVIADQTGVGGTGGNAGSWNVTKTGSGTLTLDAVNAYTGNTTVNAGTLLVNGSIVSSPTTTVNAGATLGGGGTVATTIINGGTLSPGNSIGTLTVAGNLTFAGGSTYRVEVGAAASDRTNVTGTATLAGTLQAIATGGGHASGRRYTLIHADSGFAGTTFSSVTITGFGTLVRPQLIYDINDLYLFLQAALISPSLAPNASGNQKNVAAGIDNALTNGANPNIQFNTLLGYTGSQLGTALDQISGQPATGGATSGLQMTTSFMSLLLNPFGAAPDGNSGTLGFARGFGAGVQDLSPQAAAAYAALTPADRRVADTLEQRWGLWSAGYGGYNKTNGDATAGANDLTARTWGFAGGADYRVSANAMLGFALAGGSMSWGLSQGLGGGKSDVFQVGAYGSHSFGPAYVSAALAYAQHWMSTDRTVTAVGTEVLRATFSAHSLGGRVEAGYRVATPWLDVTPYAALQVQTFRTPAYNETVASGAGAFALTYDRRTSTATRVELGSWFDRIVALAGGHALALRARAGWAHNDTSDAAISAMFQTLPGSNFVVNGAKPAANAALLSGGAELRLSNNVSLGARLDAELASRAHSYAGTGTLRYTW